MQPGGSYHNIPCTALEGFVLTLEFLPTGTSHEDRVLIYDSSSQLYSRSHVFLFHGVPLLQHGLGKLHLSNIIALSNLITSVQRTKNLACSFVVAGTLPNASCVISLLHFDPKSTLSDDVR